MVLISDRTHLGVTLISDSRSFSYVILFRVVTHLAVMLETGSDVINY